MCRVIPPMLSCAASPNRPLHLRAVARASSFQIELFAKLLMLAVQLFSTDDLWRGERRGKRLLPGCSAGTQLPICRRAGSRGVGSGCGGGSLDAFWPPEPAKKIERCQVILITLNVSGWPGEQGGGGAGPGQPRRRALAQAVALGRQIHIDLRKEIRASFTNAPANPPQPLACKCPP